MSTHDQTGKRIPALKLPADACDAHCHVFGPAAKFPYAPERRYTPEDAPKEALAALHARLGIGRAVIVQASCHGKDNRAMLDCIASDPKRFRGVSIIDDTITDRELQALHAGGVRAARFNFVKHLGGAPDLAVFHRRDRPDQGARLARRTSSRCTRYRSAVRDDSELPWPSSSTTWAASTARSAQSSRR